MMFSSIASQGGFPQITLAVGLPMLLLVFGGRQTEISTSTGTAQTRVELWREWLTTWRENMLFGKGMSLAKEEDALKRRPDQELKHLAHTVDNVPLFW